MPVSRRKVSCIEYWSPSEDKELIKLYKIHGPKWVDIVNNMKTTRNHKQARERFINHLKPGIKCGPLTKVEGQAIINLYNKVGGKWTEIAEKLGRTQLQVRNFWYNKRRGERSRRLRRRTLNKLSRMSIDFLLN